jgi:hypothetical protein
LLFMSTFRKSKINQVISSVLGVATVVFMMGGALVVPTPASAQTVDLQAQINALLAQVAALQAQLAGASGSTGGTGYVFTGDLKQGSTGEAVRQLQMALNKLACCQVAASGAGSPGNETASFGPLTKAAVVKFQNTYASEILTPLGLTAGTGYFGASSRAKMNALNAGGTTGGSTGGVVVAGDQLAVRAASSQPANALIPASAARIPFTKFTVTAGTKDVTISKVDVERQGPGDDDNFAGIVLLSEDLNTQYGLDKTLNSEHKVSVGSDVVVPAGTSKTFVIAGNAASSQTANAGQVVQLAVVGVQASSPVSGTFPIVGAAHVANASLSIGSVTMNTVSVVNTDTTLEIGKTGVVFSGVKVTAGSAEDIVVKSIKWYQTGSASKTDLNNIVTEVDGVTYPAVASADGKYYTSTFGDAGITVGKGNSKDITIKGDIIAGPARTIAFDIDRRTDLYIVGKSFGYGIIPPTGSDTATDANQEFTATNPWYDAVVITIQAGSVSSLSNDATLAPAQNVGIGVNDTLLGAYQVNIVGEPIQVAQTAIQFASGTSRMLANSITNIKIVKEDGTVIAGPVDLAAGGSATTSDTITYPTGISKYKIVGKLSTSFSGGAWAAGHTVTARMNPANHWTTVTGAVTGNTVSVSGMSQQTFSQQTVRAGSLNVTVSSQPPAQTIISGATAVELARYILDASQSGENLRISNIPLAYGGNGTATDMSSCYLYDGTIQVTDSVNPSSFSSSTSFTFTGGGLTLNANSSKTLSLKCNIQSGVTGVYYWGLDSGQQTSFTGVTGLVSGQTVTETLTDSNGQRMTAGSGGSYTVTVDNSVLYGVGEAGTTGVTLGKFRFDAGTIEGVIVKGIALELGNVASNSPQDLVNQKVTLWNGSTMVGEAQFGIGSNPDNATSTLSSPFTIPKDGSVTITVKGDLSPHNATEGTPGAILVVNYDSDNDGINGNYGTGASSGATITDSTTSDQSVNGVRIFRSVPTVAITSTGCTGCLAAGAELYKVRVTAGSGRDVGLRAMTFQVTPTGIKGGSTFTLVGPSGSLNATAVATSTANAAAGVGGSERLRINFDNTAIDRIIPAGTSKEYRLRLDTVPNVLSSVNVETLAIKLLADSGNGPIDTPFLMSRVGGATTSARLALERYSSTTDRFLWTPFSTTTPPSSGTVAMNALLDWANSYGLPGFPSPGQDMPLQSFSH